MLGHMSLDMLDKVAYSDMDGDSTDREKQIMHILKLVDSLLRAMPGTMAAVYSRLVDVWVAPNLSDEQRECIALLVSKYSKNTNSAYPIHPKLVAQPTQSTMAAVRRMLTRLQIARRELSTRQFLSYIYFAFNCADDLPPSDFAQARETIQGMLAALAKYFTPSGTESASQEISQAKEWTNVAGILRQCAQLANVDASLFTKDVVNAFARCAAQCPPDDYFYDIIRYLMGRIQNYFDALHGNW